MSGSLLVTLLGGATCGLLARRFHVPGGALIGSLLGAALIQLTTGSEQELPTAFRLVAQAAIGATIGARFEVEILAGIRRILGYAAPLLMVMMGSALALGVLFARLAGVEVPIGMLSTIPGGSGDVIAVALDLGGEAAFIATVHLGRQLLVFVSLGVIASYGLRMTRTNQSDVAIIPKVRPGILWHMVDGRLEIAVERVDERPWCLPTVGLDVLQSDEAIPEAIAKQTGLMVDATTLQLWLTNEPVPPSDVEPEAGAADPSLPLFWELRVEHAGHSRHAWLTSDRAMASLASERERSTLAWWLRHRDDGEHRPHQ